MSNKYAPGTACTVNSFHDLGCDVEARKFIGQPCVIVKETRGGLIEVALKSDPGKRYAVPKRNIDLAV